MNLQDLTQGRIVPDTMQVKAMYDQYAIQAQSQGQPVMPFDEFAKQMGVNVLPPAGPLRR